MLGTELCEQCFYNRSRIDEGDANKVTAHTCNNDREIVDDISDRVSRAVDRHRSVIRYFESLRRNGLGHKDALDLTYQFSDYAKRSNVTKILREKSTVYQTTMVIYQ